MSERRANTPLRGMTSCEPSIRIHRTRGTQRLLLAWYAQTNEADAAITAFSADSARPEESRGYARELPSRNGSSLLAAVTSLFQSEEALRSERRELMKRVSDEALLELDQKTAQIMSKRR